MTNYGTIPTSSHPSPTLVDLEPISRTKQRIKAGLSTRRPWRKMFDPQSFTLPHGLFESLSRIKTNLAYFRANYAIVFLLILFISLLYHPTSLLVLAILIVFWIFLYFLRDESLIVYGYLIDDRYVLIGLSVLTVVMLLLTHATWNIVGSLGIAVVLVLIHAVVRRCDDVDDVEASETSGLMSHPWT